MVTCRMSYSCPTAERAKIKIQLFCQLQGSLNKVGIPPGRKIQLPARQDFPIPLVTNCLSQEQQVQICRKDHHGGTPGAAEPTMGVTGEGIIT